MALVIGMLLIRHPGLLSGGVLNLNADRPEVQAMIRDYVMTNPEVIQDALEELRRREMARREEAASRQVTQHAEALFHDAGSPVGGNPDGVINVVEFFDYNCSYCRQTHEATEKLRANESVRFVFKEFPILSPGSEVAARAALAAERQGKYVAFHNALMETKGQVDEAAVMALAKKMDLDMSQLKFDMRSPEIERIIERNMKLAETIGVSGTPTFIVGEKLVAGAAQYEYLAQLVEDAKKEKSQEMAGG